MTPPTLIERLTVFVQEHPRQQITLPELWAHAIGGGRDGEPVSRSQLAAALGDLEAAGLVVFARRERDERAQPPLPGWVRRPPRAREARARPAARVWPHPLERAAALAETQEDVRLLERIGTWLRDHPDEASVPVQERSLELFGDEKALDGLRKRRVFGRGALTLELLACHDVPLPLISQHVPGAGSSHLLVVENLATFESILVAARARPSAQRGDLHVAWGQGKQFARSLRDGAIGLLDPRPASLSYFGDLDLDGIRIPVGAARAPGGAWPALQPAVELYRLLAEHGTTAPDASNRGENLDHEHLVAWFPPDLRPVVGTLLRTRRRLAQEHVGRRLLLADPWALPGAGPPQPLP